MLQRGPSFDWLVAEGDEEWEAAVQVKASRVRSNFSYKRKIFLIAGTWLSALLCLTGTMLYRRAATNLGQIETELGTVVTAEHWARQHNELDISNALIDPEAPEFWKTSIHAERSHSSATDEQPEVKIHDFQLDDEWALVRVRVDNPSEDWQIEPYLETRFYRQTGTGWLHTAPRLEFWGETTTAGSAHFAFVYRQRDASVVQAVMADIDERYTALCLELGSDPTFMAEPLHIIVQPASLPATDPGKFRFQGNRLILPSPQQMLAPAQMIEADVLRGSIMEPLAIRIVEAQTVESLDTRAWPVLRDGLSLWLRLEYGTLPSAFRHRLASGLFEWQDFDSARLDFVSSYSTLYAGSPYDGSSNIQRQAAAYTLVSYAIEDYGRSTLPVIVESMNLYDSWNELIPAVFGVPPEEFEAAWQAYLADEYQHATR